jgi:hypothetical protein
MKPAPTRLLMVVGSALLAGGALANVQTPPQQQALTMIGNFASSLCQTVAAKGSVEQWKSSADARVSLRTLIGGVADLNMSKITILHESYEGVLQADLAPLLKSELECKQKVFATLQDKLLATREIAHVSRGIFQVGELVADASFGSTMLKKTAGGPADQKRTESIQWTDAKKMQVTSMLKAAKLDVDISSQEFTSSIIENYQDSPAAGHIQALINTRFGDEATRLYLLGMEIQAYYWLAVTKQLQVRGIDPIWNGYQVFDRLLEELKEIGVNTRGFTNGEELGITDTEGFNRYLKVQFSSMGGRVERHLDDVRDAQP